MRLILLFAINTLFYLKSGPEALAVIWISICLVYLAGVLLDRTTEYRKIICGIYVILQVIMLIVFKYRLTLKNITALGISFYSLMCIGYVFDVYRKKYEPERNILKLSVFINFFPMMVQGPICRYDEIKEGLFSAKYFSLLNFSKGATRALWGLFKKLVVADRLAIACDAINSMTLSGELVAVNMLFYAFNLYANFSGGIDIAIGVAEMFGVELPENFRRPFFSKSISDYWRRWHITLGSWFRDYVFYPVSFSKPVVKISRLLRKKAGNRAAKRFPIYVSTMVVWLLTGLWHGISPNFILWGLLNGVIILISYEFEPLYIKFNNKFSFTKGRWYNCFRVIRTFCMMSILRALDYNTVSGYFKSLYLLATDFSIKHMNTDMWQQLGLTSYDYLVVVFGIIIMLVVSLLQRKHHYKELVYKRGIVFTYSLMAVMVIVIIVFGAYGTGYYEKEFIYATF